MLEILERSRETFHGVLPRSCRTLLRALLQCLVRIPVFPWSRACQHEPGKGNQYAREDLTVAQSRARCGQRFQNHVVLGPQQPRYATCPAQFKGCVRLEDPGARRDRQAACQLKYKADRGASHRGTSHPGDERIPLRVTPKVDEYVPDFSCIGLDLDFRRDLAPHSSVLVSRNDRDARSPSSAAGARQPTRANANLTRRETDFQREVSRLPPR